MCQRPIASSILFLPYQNLKDFTEDHKKNISACYTMTLMEVYLNKNY